jgi:uncharacterized membrane protein YqhA
MVNEGGYEDERIEDIMRDIGDCMNDVSNMCRLVADVWSFVGLMMIVMLFYMMFFGSDNVCVSRV